MKKLFWVNILVISTLLFVSCTTLFKNNELVVDTALNLANKQVELNQLQEAINTYDEALKHGYDYRLFYNKAIVQALSENYRDAIETALQGKKLYKDKPEFTLLLSKFYYYNSQLDEFVKTYQEYTEINNNDKNASIEFMKMCFEKGLTDTAYDTALQLWENGTNTKDVITILYSINPKEWEVVNKLFI